MNLQELYETNGDFREYVDRYCRCYRISVEEALNHKLVEEYARHCVNEGVTEHG